MKYKLKPFGLGWWITRTLGVLAVIVLLGLANGLIEKMDKPEIEEVHAASVESAAKTYEVKNTVETELAIEALIIQSCKDYEVDERLALAISRLETGHWKSKAYVELNNPGGLKEKNGGVYVVKEYETLEDGVRSFVKTLANIGSNNVDEIAETYCPDDSKGWAEKVKKIMEEHYE